MKKGLDTMAVQHAAGGRPGIGSMEDYKEIYARALRDPQGFWGEQATEYLTWRKPWHTVLDETKAPFYRWFVGGELNASYNCLDRQDPTRTALVFEGEPGDIRTYTYGELLAEVSRAANGLAALGVVKGDRVAIYMPLVPEACMAMLACARLGATHTVIFGGFSAEAVRDRVVDLGAKVIITADGGWRRGKAIALKARVDEALSATPTVEKVVVVRRTGQDVLMQPGRDLSWDELVAGQATECPPTWVEATHPLFVLYTSGTTGKPKGIEHGTGGYLLGATYTTRTVFDLRPDDVYWCSADIGWVTGHSYTVYGPLALGAQVVIYEGAPDTPGFDRFWDIIERHKVSVFYTAPTTIRTFMKWGVEWPARHDLSSLRVLGSVGEPINPAAWEWYHQTIGGSRCPVVDTWWQTETGAIMISPIPNVTHPKPGSATFPLPGVVPLIVDAQGQPVEKGTRGFLTITRPWPSMLQGFWGDPQRYRDVYWTRYPGIYNTGDGAIEDEDGYLWLLGRADEVVNISGHRLGTAEVESSLVADPHVAEAAVVGVPDDLTGQAIVAFVTPRGGVEFSDQLKKELMAQVSSSIGSFAKPRDIIFTATLPKTRSGKIMRRLLGNIAKGELLGDTTTLEDPAVVERLRTQHDEEG